MLVQIICSEYGPFSVATRWADALRASTCKNKSVICWFRAKTVKYIHDISRPMSAVMLPSNIAKFRISPLVLNSPFGRFSFAFQGAKLFSRCVPEIRGHGETKRLHTHHYSENYLHFFLPPCYSLEYGCFGSETTCTPN